MPKKWRKILILIFALFTSGCGIRLPRTSSSSISSSTASVPISSSTTSSSVSSSTSSIHSSSSSPTSSSSTVVSYDLHFFLLLLQNYSIDNTNGYNYSVIQETDGLRVNSDDIILRIDRLTDLQIQMIHTETRLNYYGDEQYHTVTRNLYYRNQQIGSHNDQDSITWTAGESEELLSSAIQSLRLTYSDFINYQINLDATPELIGSVRASKVAELMHMTLPDIPVLQITITGSTDLSSIEFHYQQAESQTTIRFEPFYDHVVVTIPE